MSYRLIHLHFRTYGAPTTLAAIDVAIDLAKTFGAMLHITSPRLNVATPSHFIAGRMLAGLADELENASAAKANELDAHAQRRAAAARVQLDLDPVAENWPQQINYVSIHGRTSDLCVLSLPQANVEQRLNVESWVFGVGRPCLLVPENFEASFSSETCCIAWDGSKAAARAVSDALPLLKRAQRVFVLVGRNEKLLEAHLTPPLEAFLRAHGVPSSFQDVDVSGRNVGDALLEEAHSRTAGVLIMGAYGHSRLQEFILGGATRRVLDSSQIPLLMSH